MKSFAWGSAILFLAIIVSGCAAMGPELDQPRGSANETSEDGDERLGVEILTSSAPEGLQRLGRHTTYQATRCYQAGNLQKAREATLAKLVDEAAAAGADVLQVLGTGSLSNRGFCINDMFQMTGVSFRDRPDPMRDSQSAADLAEGSTQSIARHLLELRSLKDRGLISMSEYKELREYLLDQLREEY